MKKIYITGVLVMLMTLSCKREGDQAEITCSDLSCEGTYIGPEFILWDDVAHQFSNKMCDTVGDVLKDLYRRGQFSKVDFNRITMTTEGMGSGRVVYKVSIPFSRVQEKCEAFTSFDHSGGWNHEPALSGRKAQLRGALLSHDTLDISELKQTKEGLQEYWIQWRNKELQSDCELR
ncbi:MAG: hypothetical protein ACKO6L_04955 [Flavobacteriales bacterium]